MTRPTSPWRPIAVCVRGTWQDLPNAQMSREAALVANELGRVEVRYDRARGQPVMLVRERV